MGRNSNAPTSGSEGATGPSTSGSTIAGVAGNAVRSNVMGTSLGLQSESDKTVKLHPSISAAHDLVLLSLSTLASLSVPSSRSILVIQNSVLPYLLSDDYRIRKEAARTCAKMLISIMRKYGTKVKYSISLHLFIFVVLLSCCGVQK